MHYRPRGGISKKKILGVALAAAMSLGAAGSALAVPVIADIIAVVDESGSMATEHAWLPGMINAMDAALLAAAGSDTFSVQYGLTGYGASSHGVSQRGHVHDMDGATPGDQQFGSATDFAAAAGGLVTSGGTEDGYEAMQFVLDNYSLRPNARTNLILVTDEDRDTNGGPDKSSMLNALKKNQALVNAVINCDMFVGNDRVLGVDSKGNGYVADGQGGFTMVTGTFTTGSCAGSTETDYIDLALATGGAAWDLDLLRAGGLTADSFTAAFVDIKVGEIITPPPQVPEAGTLALLGIGLTGLGFARRRKAKS